MNQQYADAQTRGRERRQEILAFVASYTAQHRMSPTIKEIGAAVGLSSTSTVAAHLRILEREGVITHSLRVPRSICLTGPRGLEEVARLAALLTEARGPVQALAMDGSLSCADLLERIDRGLSEVAA